MTHKKHHRKDRNPTDNAVRVNSKLDDNYRWFRKDWVNIILIFLASIFYTSTIIFSNNTFIPSGIDFDSNLSPIVNTIKSGFSLWDDSWWLGFPDYAGSLSNLFYPVSDIIFTLFGAVLGLKLLIFIHILLSGIGFYYFSQYLSKNNFVRLYGAIIYMLSGNLAVKTIAGHLEKIFVFPWIPITLYLVYRAIETKQPKYIIFSSISASMFLFAGDLYGALFFAILFTAFITCKIINSRDRETVYTFAKIITLTLLISAIRWVPILFIKSFISRDIDVLQGLEHIMDVPSRFYSTATEPSYGIWESYSFIGMIPFVLFIIGLLLHKSRDKYYLILPIVAALFWVQGDFPVLARAIHFMPVLDNFRNPTRIYMLVTFCIIAISTLGFDYLINVPDTFKKPNSRDVISIIVCVLLFASSYNLYTTNSKFFMLDLDQANEKIYDAISNDINSNAQNPNTPTLVTIIDPAAITQQHAFLENGLHYFNAYYGYSFGAPDHINSSGMTYSIPDVKLMINPVGSERQQIQVQITTQKYNNTLPFAFVIKNNGDISNDVNVESYQSGNVLVNAVNVSPGDIIALKTSYYIGWSIKLNEGDNYVFVNNYQGLVSYNVTQPQEKLRIRFVYYPIDLYIGLIVMLFSIPFSIMFVVKKNKKL